ncbi:hypothetical protein KO317_03010 [Candidatus Micrarchaeota archaeon]|nr:hypothetical protein [Candidatus Micrarchaeota archaeon]
MVNPKFKELTEQNRNYLRYILKPEYLSLYTSENEIPFKNKAFVCSSIFLNSKFWYLNLFDNQSMERQSISGIINMVLSSFQESDKKRVDAIYSSDSEVLEFFKHLPLLAGFTFPQAREVIGNMINDYKTHRTAGMGGKWILENLTCIGIWKEFSEAYKKAIRNPTDQNIDMAGFLFNMAYVNTALDIMAFIGATKALEVGGKQILDKLSKTLLSMKTKMPFEASIPFAFETMGSKMFNSNLAMQGIDDLITKSAGRAGVSSVSGTIPINTVITATEIFDFTATRVENLALLWAVPVAIGAKPLLAEAIDINAIEEERSYTSVEAGLYAAEIGGDPRNDWDPFKNFLEDSSEIKYIVADSEYFNELMKRAEKKALTSELDKLDIFETDLRNTIKFLQEGDDLIEFRISQETLNIFENSFGDPTIRNQIDNIFKSMIDEDLIRLTNPYPWGRGEGIVNEAIELTKASPLGERSPCLILTSKKNAGFIFETINSNDNKIYTQISEYIANNPPLQQSSFPNPLSYENSKSLTSRIIEYQYGTKPVFKQPKGSHPGFYIGDKKICGFFHDHTGELSGSQLKTVIWENTFGKGLHASNKDLYKSLVELNLDKMLDPRALETLRSLAGY